MSFIQQALIFISTLAILIAFHEYGHFLIARRCGVKVLRFSIGFGPVLWRFYDKQGTEFAVSALPFGGYVKMLDEREDEVAESEKHLSFNSKTPWQRMAIAAAGPVANFLLAIFVYWLVFLQGSTGLLPQVFSVEEHSIASQAGLPLDSVITAVDGKSVQTVSQLAKALSQRLGETGEIEFTVQQQGNDIEQSVSLSVHNWLSEAEDSVDLFASLGFGFYQAHIPAVIDKVMPASSAERAGLTAGDEIISMDGDAVKDWQHWVAYVQERPAQELKIEVLRQGEIITKTLRPQAVEQGSKLIGQVGIQVQVPELPDYLLVKQKYSVLGALLAATDNTWQMAKFSVLSLKKMLLGQLSYKQLSGPISIAKVVNQSALYGIFSYLSLLALLSISLGVLNLLPIPVLDGGHILFCLLEILRGGRELPEKIQIIAFQFGMFVVLTIMLLAVFNDLGRL